MSINDFVPKQLRKSPSYRLNWIIAISCLATRRSAAFDTPDRTKPSPSSLSGVLNTAGFKKDPIWSKRLLTDVDGRGLSPLPMPLNPKKPLLEQQMARLSDATNAWPITVMILCWGVTFLSALDRVAMSVAIVPLAEELGINDEMKGQISSVFSVGYGLSILPVGIALSRISPRLMMGMGMAIWSLATLATPLTASCDTIGPLLMSRAAVGAAESVVMPTIQRILAEWIPADRKSVATAVVFSGFQAGTIAAYIVSPYVIGLAGTWRGMFFSYGAIGLGCLLPWFIFAKDSPTCASDNLFNHTPISNTAGDQKHVSHSSHSTPLSLAISTFQAAPLREMLSSRGVQGMTIAHAANNWGMYNILAWAPTFYAEQYGLNVKESTLFSVLPSIGGTIGGIVAGLAADAWIRSDPNLSNEGLTRIRKIFQGIALYCPSTFLATLAFDIPDEPVVAQSLLMCIIGLQAFNSAGYGPAPQEKAGIKWSGLLYSVSSLPCVIFGALGVYVTGQILEQRNQDWSLVFSLNALVDVAGATGFLLLYNATKEFD